MSILVTGGAGYIGSHMVIELLAQNEDVIILDNLVTGRRQLVNKSAKFIEGSIGDSALLRKIFSENEIEAIIHFAGSTVVPESVTDPLKYYGNNTANSRILIEESVKHNVKHFIFSSTAAVYGTPDSVPVKETNQLKPDSPYGTSKLMTEMMLRDVSKAHPLTHVALRYFNVAGADPDERTGQSTPEATHLIKVACQAALGHRPEMHIFGDDYSTPDGTGVRDYIQVTDLVKAHLHALNYLRNGGESTVFNCGYGRGYSVKEVVDIVKQVSGVDFKVVVTERRPGDMAEVIANVEKIHGTLEWRPEQDDLTRIVTQALTWEKKLETLELD